MRFSIGKILEHVSRWGTVGTEDQQRQYTTYPWGEINVKVGDEVRIVVWLQEEESLELQCWHVEEVEECISRWGKMKKVKWVMECECVQDLEE